MSSSSVLVQSTHFSMKMQPKLFLPPVSSHSLITLTVSSWAHLILSSNLSREFKTLQQDSSSWHLSIMTLHLSSKSCIGFPFQSMHVLPCYKWLWSCLPPQTATYLHSILHVSLLFSSPHALNPTWLSHFHLL